MNSYQGIDMREANNQSSEPNKMVFQFEKSSNKLIYFATLPSKQDIGCFATPFRYTWPYTVYLYYKHYHFMHSRHKRVASEKCL